MPNPAWPSTLPSPLDDTADYAPLMDNVIRSSMETGSPKTRRRFTAVPETFTGGVLLTGAQCATLLAFAVTTLQDVLPFDWKDFRTGAAATYTFQKRPTFTRVKDSRGMWRASIELLKKP